MRGGHNLNSLIINTKYLLALFRFAQKSPVKGLLWTERVFLKKTQGFV